MKIVCTYDNLKGAVESCERIISRQLTLPILNNVLLKAEKGLLTISSTNLEIGIVVSCSCKTTEAGAITVPAKILSGILANLSAETVTLSIKKGETLVLEGGKYRGEIKGQSAADFPIIPHSESPPTLTLNAGGLAQALSRVVGFTALSETRPELTGVFVTKDHDEAEVRVVSTDSFRLAEARVPVGKASVQASVSFVLPQRTCVELMRLSQHNEEAAVVLDANQCEVILEKWRLVTRLVEGSYPDYGSFVPKNFGTECEVEREALIKNVRLVSLFSGKVHDIRLQFSHQEQKITLYAADGTLGESTVEMPGSITGEDLEVHFNWRYLLEGLQQVEGKKVRVRLVDSAKPTLIKSEGDPYLYIVMPIRA
jgi:DNA polymerase-3 subunit beta